MALVVAIIALVIARYHQLVARFPEGGGAAAGAGRVRPARRRRPAPLWGGSRYG